MAIWVQRIGTYNIILQVGAVVKFQKRQFVIILYHHIIITYYLYERVMKSVSRVMGIMRYMV